MGRKEFTRATALTDTEETVVQFSGQEDVSASGGQDKTIGPIDAGGIETLKGAGVSQDGEDYAIQIEYLDADGNPIGDPQDLTETLVNGDSGDGGDPTTFQFGTLDVKSPKFNLKIEDFSGTGDNTITWSVRGV